MEDIESYGERTQSSLLYMLLSQQARPGLLDHSASHLGKAMAIIGFLRSAHPLVRLGHDPGIPMELLAAKGISQEGLKSVDVWKSEELRWIVHRMATRAMEHLEMAEKHSVDQTSPLKPMIILVRRYLSKLQSINFDLSDPRLYQRDGLLPISLAWYIWRGTKGKSQQEGSLQ